MKTTMTTTSWFKSLSLILLFSLALSFSADAKKDVNFNPDQKKAKLQSDTEAKKFLVMDMNRVVDLIPGWLFVKEEKPVLIFTPEIQMDLIDDDEDEDL